MKKIIHLGKGLDLDAYKLATSMWAALGNRGSGKTSLAGVIAEGIMDAGYQVIVLDAVGPWFSLRLDRDGKTPSRFQIPVLGGVHGDIDLQSGAGRQVAEALAQSGSSAVLDISMMSKSGRVRFAADFAEAFFEAKKRFPGPVCVLLEEAQRLVPQIIRQSHPDIMRCLGAFEEMYEVGRNFGIGGGLISLRPEKVNKDALNLSETVFAFRMLGIHERKAVSEWVQEKGAEGRKDVVGELPSLDIGTAIVWSPGVFKVYGHHQLVLKTTFDASSTPDKSRTAVKMKALDLAQLEQKMAAVVVDAKRNDPKLLKARIAELERELAKKPAAVPAPVVKGREKPALSEADHKRLDRLVDRLDTAERAFLAEVRAGHEKSSKLIDLLSQRQQVLGSRIWSLLKNVPSSTITVTADKGALAEHNRDFARREKAGEFRVSMDGGPTPGLQAWRTLGERLPEKSQKMLGALHQGEAMGLKQMPFRNVAVIAGVAPTSGTTSNRKGQLVKLGLIAVLGKDVQLTDAGRAYPINVSMPPSDPNELLAFWKREIGTEKIAAILETVVRQGPISNEALAAAVGMENSGTFSNYKGALVQRGLIEKVGKAYVATEVFRGV